MIKKKIKLYYKILVLKIFQFFYGKVILKKKTSTLFSLITVNNRFHKTLENKKYNIYFTKKARIYTDNVQNVAVIKNNTIIPNMSFQQVNGRLKKKNNSVLKYGTPSLIKKISGTVLTLVQGGSGNNYFHFIFDIIPKIYLIKKEKLFQKIDFFYVSRPTKWQIKIFKLLQISKKKLIDSNKSKHISADQIIAIDHPWYQKGYMQDQVKNIPEWIVTSNRQLFLNKAKKFKSKKKIFLDRSSSLYNHCQIYNQKEINEWIDNNHLGTYYTENLSFEKQIFLFNNASTILGAHGAAFTNIIFCKPGTKIIEIIPANHPNRKCERICKILKLNYFRITTRPDNSNKNFPYRIHLETNHLKKIKKLINL
jgi:capsular polysaccharide biosynthesis protein